MVRTFAHFSLAPFVSIGDNPALSNEGDARLGAERMGGARSNRGTLSIPSEGRNPEA
jgi:hypothetical protein